METFLALQVWERGKVGGKKAGGCLRTRWVVAQKPDWWQNWLQAVLIWVWDLTSMPDDVHSIRGQYDFCIVIVHQKIASFSCPGGFVSFGSEEFNVRGVQGGPQTAFLEQSSGFYWWQEVHLLITSLQENANDKTKKHKFGKKFAWAILSCLFIFQSVEVKISLQSHTFLV